MLRHIGFTNSHVNKFAQQGISSFKSLSMFDNESLSDLYSVTGLKSINELQKICLWTVRDMYMTIHIDIKHNNAAQMVAYAKQITIQSIAQFVTEHTEPLQPSVLKTQAYSDPKSNRVPPKGCNGHWSKWKQF
jgi:hypothetical protein